MYDDFYYQPKKEDEPIAIYVSVIFFSVITSLQLVSLIQNPDSRLEQIMFIALCMMDYLIFLILLQHFKLEAIKDIAGWHERRD